MKRCKPATPVLVKGRAVVGIDVGKRKHAATALTPQGEMIAQLASFCNTRQGIDLLESEVLRKAGGPGKVLVVMEATGHYWMCLYYELQRRGCDGVVLNPLQTNAHSRSQIRKNRNDRIDSEGIARLVLAGEARATRVPDEKTAELRLWVRHRQRLLRTAGDMERFAHTLVDRVFPEYAEVLSKPFLPSAQKLIRQFGLARPTSSRRKPKSVSSCAPPAATASLPPPSTACWKRPNSPSAAGRPRMSHNSNWSWSSTTWPLSGNKSPPSKKNLKPASRNSTRPWVPWE